MVKSVNLGEKQCARVGMVKTGPFPFVGFM